MKPATGSISGPTLSRRAVSLNQPRFCAGRGELPAVAEEDECVEAVETGWDSRGGDGSMFEKWKKLTENYNQSRAARLMGTSKRLKEKGNCARSDKERLDVSRLNQTVRLRTKSQVSERLNLSQTSQLRIPSTNCSAHSSTSMTSHKAPSSSSGSSDSSSSSSSKSQSSLSDSEVSMDEHIPVRTIPPQTSVPVMYPCPYPYYYPTYAQAIYVPVSPRSPVSTHLTTPRPTLVPKPSPFSTSEKKGKSKLGATVPVLPKPIGSQKVEASRADSPGSDIETIPTTASPVDVEYHKESYCGDWERYELQRQSKAETPWCRKEKEICTKRLDVGGPMGAATGIKGEASWRSSPGESGNKTSEAGVWRQDKSRRRVYA